jgi:hypothetical protein
MLAEIVLLLYAEQKLGLIDVSSLPFSDKKVLGLRKVRARCEGYFMDVRCQQLSSHGDKITKSHYMPKILKHIPRQYTRIKYQHWLSALSCISPSFNFNNIN